MSNTTISPNMNLPIPVVGVESGPDWASDINSSLTLVDSHTHAAGSGVQITPAGISINSDLPFGGNNGTALRTIRFTSQAAALALPTDLGCLYEVLNDLYFNDGVGNQVRITQSGAVAGSPGSIANLVSPASATYVSGTPAFVFQSNSNVSANLDGGSIVLRNLTASSKGLTLAPPNAMGSDYTITLPALPGSGTKFMTLTSAGNVGAAWAVDNSTLEVSANVVQVKALGITSTQIALQAVGAAQIQDLQVTREKLAQAGQQISSSTGLFGTASASPVAVTNASVSFTVSNVARPVFITLIPDGNGLGNGASVGNSALAQGYIYIMRDSTEIGRVSIIGNIDVPPGCVTMYDTTMAPSTTYTYSLKASCSAGGNTAVKYCKLFVEEQY